MSATPSEYPRRAREALLRGPAVREAVTAATLAFDEARERAYAEIDAPAWRTWAAGVKDHALSHLAESLEQAEERLRRRGATVHWAETEADVHAVLRSLVADRGLTRAVKGKSMVSEEVGVNALLGALGVDVLETDLGEYVIQLLGEPPSHIVGPAIHRSLDDIRRLFADRLGTAEEASPEALAAAARRVLREGFLSADLGVTGANFLVAETGSLAIMENEGNIRLSTSLPRVHVALVGIEKVLPRWDDLAGFLQLTARAATGQQVATFVSILQGPREAEGEGPEELHVVLVDNGRTKVLADPEMWTALRCVRCGACLNTCPVYRQTGGHAYGWVYSGPIGSVLAPAMLGLEAAHALPFASSLCGACGEACPVRIPLPDQLVEWRRRSAEAGLSPLTERAGLAAFGAVATHPTAFRAAGRVARSLPVLPLPSGWRPGRAAPRPSDRTFRERWRAGDV